MNTVDGLLATLKKEPAAIQFSEVIALIDGQYHYTPTTFKNGTLTNAANENNGSCKLLAFATLHQLSEQDTLYLFGDYYRKEVLESPEGSDHQNIRNFMKYGWEGVYFENSPLKRK